MVEAGHPCSRLGTWPHYRQQVVPTHIESRERSSVRLRHHLAQRPRSIDEVIDSRGCAVGLTYLGFHPHAVGIIRICDNRAVLQRHLLEPIVKAPSVSGFVVLGGEIAVDIPDPDLSAAR